jgi:hypothetical protein
MEMGSSRLQYFSVHNFGNIVLNQAAVSEEEKICCTESRLVHHRCRRLCRLRRRVGACAQFQSPDNKSDGFVPFR